jgi:hypothetical protein
MGVSGVSRLRAAIAVSFATGLLSVAAPGPVTALEGCQAPPIDVAERLSEKITSALRTGNAIELRLLYAADAVLISPAHLKIRDRSQDVSRYLEQLATRLRLVDSRGPTFRTGCNTVVAYGDAKFAGRLKGGKQTFWMRYSRVFERRNGVWLVTLDHMSPAPGHDARAAIAAPSAPPQRSAPLRPAKRSINRVRDRAELSALVQSIAPSGRPIPQVRGVAMRALPEASEAPVLPPRPQLVQQPAQPATPEVAKAVPPSRPAIRNRARKPTGDTSWVKNVRGFFGNE